jgi:hypothetical protein
MIGIVSPGLKHCNKNVNRLFNPSGVVEWKAGWKYFNFSLSDENCKGESYSNFLK